jgi:uracil-DNA glycosylase
VDAKERLRRYLEQRREAGETEIIFDDADAARALRALATRGESTVAPAPKRAPSAEGPRRESRRSSAAPRVDESPPAPESDWRAALRAVDAGPRLKAPAPTTASSTAPPPTSPPPESTPRLSLTGREPEPETSPVSLEHVPAGLSVGSADHELFGGPPSPYQSLADIARAVAQCTRCPLYKSAKNPVPGEGNANADLMCVGEAPGATEDDTGRPFVGQAGQLLTNILKAINLSREQVFICNVLKHRPPGNRNPAPSEVEACSPYLIRQIELIKPKVILALGTFAAQTLLNTKLPIGKLRGSIHRYYGVPLIVTYHPAALLRNPSWKRPTWEDVQLAQRILERARA